MKPRIGSFCLYSRVRPWRAGGIIPFARVGMFLHSLRCSQLRSPLNAVLGFSQLMLCTQNLPSEQYENTGIIYCSRNYVLILINNILDLSKIEAGKTTLNPAILIFITCSMI
ncbi:histidine kinase dimerization/phospho-acceptor domain-containing protein [Nostoc sp.]|uniref:histidine kinase dimerization/phospho-acceptor domain-containing protein n=1 Tax=Nostoc sp. TaxID=1180 RepID=UPI002FF723FC